MHPLSASRLNDFLGCPHQAALWLAGVMPGEEADATLQLVRDKGFEHEAAVLARLEKLHGPAERIPSDAAQANAASRRISASTAARRSSALRPFRASRSGRSALKRAKPPSPTSCWTRQQNDSIRRVTCNASTGTSGANGQIGHVGWPGFGKGVRMYRKPEAAPQYRPAC